MQTKPILDFENDYCLTENGEIMDLQTGKFKKYYFRGNEKKPRVDLYKNGILEVSMYVEDIIREILFDKTSKEYYKFNYKDNDVSNLSLNNIEIIINDKYVTKQQIKKPKKVFNISLSGALVKNTDEINKVREINFQNTKIRSNLKKQERRTGRPVGRPRKSQNFPENFFSDLGV